jgi:type IV pilus assembly protein PilC
MLFNYTAIDDSGKEQKGTIDAISLDVAIAALQRRGFVISSIHPEGKGPLFSRNINIFERVSAKEKVILSRQIATLFGAHISAVRVFRLLGDESENPLLRRTLTQVVSDLEGGSSISRALSMHPKVFNDFYANIVRAGEESGKIANSFISLADHLDRTYELSSKAGYAMVYPAFVVVTFIGVMYLCLPP